MRASFDSRLWLRGLAAAAIGLAGVSLAVAIAVGASGDPLGAPYEISGKFQKSIVSIAWPQVPGVAGYELIIDGRQVATAGPNSTTTRFSVTAGQHTLTVQPFAAAATSTSTTSTTATTTTAPTTTVATTTTAPTTTTTSTPPTGMPQQGISMPLGNITGKSSSDQAWMLDQIVALGHGHPMFLRTDWWPGDAGFQALAPKVAARPSIVLMPLLNYDPGNRPSQSAFATQAGQLAQLGYRYIDVLNEPDMSGWTPQDAAAYFMAAKAAIKRVNPNAVVIGPSTWKTHTQNPADGFAWDKAFLDAGGKPDVFDLHLYNYFSCDRAWNNWSYLPDIRAALDAHGLSSVPIMTTEAGDNADLNGTSRQQDAVVTGMAARDKGYVAHGCTVTVPIVSFVDYSLLNDATPGGFGLLDSNRNQRPAYGSFVTLAR